MSDDPLATFGNTTKGGHRGPSELKTVCPNPHCRRYIARYPCPYCRYTPGALDREPAPAQPPWWESQCDIIDGEVILRCTFYCDDCGKQVERFRHKEYAYEFFTFSPHWCQQCQDKKARR